MVGIVLVSHSHRLAEGTADLARQMGGDEARIETAGGLDTPDHELGTDAVLVMQAIERAWTPDGVLVLMDLGSAVLSAEMALDLLPDAINRSRVLLVEAPFVEGAVAAAVTARIGASLERVAGEARGGLTAKATHLGAEQPAAVAPPPATGGPAAEIELDVPIPHGLHARPAAAFVRTASSFDAEVAVENLAEGRGPVSARSLNAVATLGVRRGDRIRVSASGPQALEAIEAVRALADRRFDEAEEAEEVAAGREDEARPTSGANGPAGLAAAPGVAVGPVVRFTAGELPSPDVPARSPEEERRSLERAVEETRRDIERQRASVAGRAGAYRAAIFDAHVLLLQDDALLGAAMSAVGTGASAASAWSDAVAEVAAAWASMRDEYQRERAEDVRSVGAQVLARILGVEVPAPRMRSPGVLVAPDLTPADTASLDPSTALGIATSFGGPTSHAAVLARSLGIPAVVAIGEAILDLAQGTLIAIDGSTGSVVVDPPPDVVAALEGRRREQVRADRAAKAEARAPAVTADGASIEVAANVGTPADVAHALEMGCDGIGLFRTEFLFMERGTAPTEDEQEAAYRGVAQALDGRPMIVRTLDAGADKPLPYLHQPAEANPFLGLRGLRLGLAMPDLLDTQLRAILRVAADHPLRVMFPMVATVEEFRQGSAALDRARRSLSDRGVLIPVRPEVGVMIEVPSAALLAERLAEEADFFSIGTNDLTQYTLAAERGNARVAGLLDALHPAVLALIGRTAEAAAANRRWVGVCGELAADPAVTSLLLGLGVTELSASAPAIPHVKRAVRATSLPEATALAERALRLASAEQVRELVRGAEIA